MLPSEFQDYEYSIQVHHIMSSVNHFESPK